MARYRNDSSGTSSDDRASAVRKSLEAARAQSIKIQGPEGFNNKPYEDAAKSLQKINALEKDRLATAMQLIKVEEQISKEVKEQDKRRADDAKKLKQHAASLEKQAQIQENLLKYAENHGKLDKNKVKSMQEEIELTRQRAEEEKAAAQEEENRQKTKWAWGKKTLDLEEQKNRALEKQAKNEEISQKNQEKMAAAAGKVKDAFKSAFSGDAFAQNLKLMESYTSILNTRLIGSGKSFSTINDMVASNTLFNPFITANAVLNNVAKLADEGVAYNIEQRAFLATISDKIATTFNVANGTLLRLIRLQQADSTEARLGMEAALNKYFNQMFEDTSYLREQRESVSASIQDAIGLLSRNEGYGVEYVLQKWLGSLYSVGLSSSAVNTLASGINMLGTGAVDQLSGSPMQTLLAMAASRGGVSYANILQKGLDASNVNKLMASMVTYLKEIANGTNNVVKAAYSNVFGLGVSDFRAISNLSASDIAAIAAANMNFEAGQEYARQMAATMYQRMAAGEMIDNVLENAKWTFAAGVASNPVLAGLYKVTDMVENLTGGINLPAISVFGNMIDLSAFTVEGLIKTGIVGAGLLGNLTGVLGGLTHIGSVDSGLWGAREVTRRGTGWAPITTGTAQGTSFSSIVSSGSGEDIQSGAIGGATEDAKKVGDITSAGSEDHTFEDLWQYAVGPDAEGFVNVRIVQYDDLITAISNPEYNVKVALDRSGANMSYGY